MPKILKDTEILDIIRRAVEDKNTIECADAYERFLEDLGELIATHFGGIRGGVGRPDFSEGREPGDHPDELGWTCAFHANDSVPSDGGIFADYDQDVQWTDGEETPT